MKNRFRSVLSIAVGHIILWVLKTFRLGNGTSLPGYISLKLYPNLTQNLVSKNKLKVIFVAGTNGKTTTAMMIEELMKKLNFSVFRNSSGANLMSGLTTTLLKKSSFRSLIQEEFAVLEVDENILPLILKSITPHQIVLTNLFRDQLDRYGEVDSIAKKWESAFVKLSEKTTIIANGDDPLIAAITMNTKTQKKFYGITDSEMKLKHIGNSADSHLCYACGERLTYSSISYSHLGNWRCSNCGLSTPVTERFSPQTGLEGIHNSYNALAAQTSLTALGKSTEEIENLMTHFQPAFGRQELIPVGKKFVLLLLSKNPVSFNQNLETAISKGHKDFLILLNNNHQDGLDISWIWDIDFEAYLNTDVNVWLSGERAVDMAQRIDNSSENTRQISLKIPFQKSVVSSALQDVQEAGTLVAVTNYSAMLDLRHLLLGEKFT